MSRATAKDFIRACKNMGIDISIEDDEIRIEGNTPEEVFLAKLAAEWLADDIVAILHKPKVKLVKC